MKIVAALPIGPNTRILEIGCGPGAAARAIAGKLRGGHILAIDRSSKAIAQAEKVSKTELATGRLTFRKCRVEEFELEEDDEPFDFAFAIRVGALDGRHPEIEAAALARISAALKPKGRLFIDGGSPLIEVKLPTGKPVRIKK